MPFLLLFLLRTRRPHTDKVRKGGTFTELFALSLSGRRAGIPVLLSKTETTIQTMQYLLLAIAAMSLIMLALKFFNVKKIYIPQAIMTNYAFALIIALFSGGRYLAAADAGGFGGNGWGDLALITGALYFGSMDLMAASTRRVGVSITTMASRTSVILPIVWAALFLGERITGWELLGTALVMLAFVFIIYRPHDKGTDTATGRNERLKTVLLPVGVFLSVGFIAVCMKTSQHLIKTEGCYETDYPVFEIMLFSAAFLGAVAYYAAKEGREAFRFRWKSIAGGLCLGTFNYFVTFGLMHGFKYFSSSTFYGIYNISVVLLTTLVGIAAFGEKLDGRKTVGMLFAVASIFVLGFLGGSL